MELAQRPVLIDLLAQYPDIHNDAMYLMSLTVQDRNSYVGFQQALVPQIMPFFQKIMETEQSLIERGDEVDSN